MHSASSDGLVVIARIAMVHGHETDALTVGDANAIQSLSLIAGLRQQLALVEHL